MSFNKTGAIKAALRSYPLTDIEIFLNVYDLYLFV